MRDARIRDSIVVQTVCVYVVVVFYGTLTGSCRRSLLFFVILQTRPRINYLVVTLTRIARGGKEERILTTRVNSSQKENIPELSRVGTLPCFDLFCLSLISSLSLSPSPSFLLSSRLILFPFPSAALRSRPIYRKHANPQTEVQPSSLEEQKPRPACRAFLFGCERAARVFNSLPFSFPRRGIPSLCVALVLLYPASVQLEHRVGADAHGASRYRGAVNQIYLNPFVTIYAAFVAALGLLARPTDISTFSRSRVSPVRPINIPGLGSPARITIFCMKDDDAASAESR